MVMGIRVGKKNIYIYDGDLRVAKLLKQTGSTYESKSMTFTVYNEKKLLVTKNGRECWFNTETRAPKKNVVFKNPRISEAVPIILIFAIAVPTFVFLLGPPDLVSPNGVYRYKFDSGLYKNGQITKDPIFFENLFLHWFLWCICEITDKEFWTPGDTLPIGSRLEELRNGDYSLTPTTDGKLRLTNTNTGKQIYAIGAYKYIIMQADGNLVAYDKNNYAVWASDFGGELSLTNDGKVKIGEKVLFGFEPELVDAPNVLLPGEEKTYAYGRVLLKTETFEVTQSSDRFCSFHIRKRGDWSNRRYADLSTTNSCYNIVMQKDGNLVALDINKNPVWASNTTGYVHLELSNEGQLYLKKDNKTIIYTF